MSIYSDGCVYNVCLLKGACRRHGQILQFYKGFMISLVFSFTDRSHTSCELQTQLVRWKRGGRDMSTRSTLYWFCFRWCWCRWRNGSRRFGLGQDHWLEGSSCDGFNHFGHLQWKYVSSGDISQKNIVIKEMSSLVRVKGKQLDESLCKKVGLFPWSLINSPEQSKTQTGPEN